MLAVFPANVNMAVDAERFDAIPEPLLWARLPLQAGIIYWIWRVAVRRWRYFGRQTAMMSRIEMMPTSSPSSTTTR